MEPLPLPRPVTDGVEYQVTNSKLLSFVRVFTPDGIVREIKATFDNGAVIRMTVAVPYSLGYAQPEAGEMLAGPLPA